jgi:hypothetical protein
MDFHKFQLGLLGASVHCRHNIISHENQEISIPRKPEQDKNSSLKQDF